MTNPSDQFRGGNDSNPPAPGAADTGLPWPRTWRGVYTLVFGCFVAVVLLLAGFTWAFS